MRNYLSKFLAILSLFVILIFMLFVINQTVQIIALANNLHPLLGQVVTIGLLLIYAVLLLIPLYMYVRLPKALKPPESNQSAEITIYLENLSKRLTRNQFLKGVPVSNRREIEEALKILEFEADGMIRRNATAVFITTAISQSGRLDTFTVLLAQIRMVWQVASLYYQRPTLRELLHLYSNVMATAFIAGELNEVDISRQVEPIVTSVLGASLTSSIPGVNLVAGIVTNSLLSGSANAYLTLRIGIISKKYCSSLLKIERGVLRRSASVEAAKMLSLIVMNSAGNITKSIVNAALKSPGKISKDVLRATWEKLLRKEKFPTEFSGE